ncbi:hypothetical protein WN51_08675 [Melipona quadrifasciata]|uniref:Uncharacterized protein n=1 Tax=Melipona quadrifasciata TaxID=166423 RepID=A0A0M9A8Z8_9HYME|nr:hypothetical protein WN51_08675 [Melipona quadrifasciata]
MKIIPPWEPCSEFELGYCLYDSRALYAAPSSSAVLYFSGSFLPLDSPIGGALND